MTVLQNLFHKWRRFLDDNLGQSGALCERSSELCKPSSKEAFINGEHFSHNNPPTQFFRFLEHVSSKLFYSEIPEILQKNFLSVESGLFERRNHLMSPDVNTEKAQPTAKKKTFQKVISVLHRKVRMKVFCRSIKQSVQKAFTEASALTQTDYCD